MFKTVFIALSFLTAFVTVVGQLYMFGHGSRFVREKFVTFCAVLTILFCLACLVQMFLSTPLFAIVCLICAFSPFIIGKFVTYEKLSFYTFLQAFVIFLPGFCALMF